MCVQIVVHRVVVSWQSWPEHDGRPIQACMTMQDRQLPRMPASAALRFVSGWRPGEWCRCMAPSGRFMTFSQLSIGLGGMALRLVQIAMDARDDSAVGRFWAEALGWGVSSEEPGVTNVEPVGFAYPDPVAVCIDVIAVPEPKTVKNRVHIDLATTSAAHQADLVARLTDLGATPADIGQGDVSWSVLADPEGNEFCVLAPWPGGRDTGPVAAVNVDCADPRAMARFWGEAMDWTLHQVTGDHAVLRSAKGVGPYLQFLRTPGMKTVKNRVHLDLRPYPGDDQAAEAARLRALGATDIDLGQGDVPWTCLADPEGNEFDVLTPR